MVVAGYLGVATEKREISDIAAEVAETALAQFGQQHGEIVYTKRATPNARRAGESSASYPARWTARSPSSCTAHTRVSTSTPRTS